MDYPMAYSAGLAGDDSDLADFWQEFLAAQNAL
jgi:hypothetical protein